MSQWTEIPIDQLAEDTLCSVIESFVLREGTDYGSAEHSLAQKVAQVRRQLERGEVLLMYDHSSDSCQLMTQRDYRRLLAEAETGGESLESNQ